MIDPNWTVMDLDPRTWRNLGQFLEVAQYVRTAQPGEKALFVLHQDGRPLNVYDSGKGRRPELVPAPFGDPHLLANDLFETGEWDRVHVINKQHLRAVAGEALVIANRALTLDAYYHRVFELVWGKPRGYVSVPPHPGHWHGWGYQPLKDFVTRLTAPAALVLGVLEGAEVALGVILVVEGGVIRRVTTFEALTSAQPPALTPAGFEQLWLSVTEQLAPPAAALLCTRAAFEQWIAASDKLASLRAAAETGEALWRLA